VGLLVKRMPARGRSRALREVGEDFGRELAAAAGLKPDGQVGEGLEGVCDALGSLGFQVSVVSVEGDQAELASLTCPLRPLVVKCPEAAGIDQGMWAGLLEGGVRGLAADRVRCETPRCQSRKEACQIFLALAATGEKASRRAQDRR
jgi:predicted hydrocarbon binding protein